MSATQCIFCKIISGQISSELHYEDEQFIAIKDIQPHAKAHFLVIPKKHIAALSDAFPDSTSSEYELLMGQMLGVGTRLARQKGLLPQGFRSVLNTGSHAGQTVFHIHLHILGSEPLGSFGA